MAPPPIFPLPKPAPTATTDSCEHSERPVDARHCALLPLLIATLPSPDREIVLLRIVAGVSIPDVVAVLGVTSAAVRLVGHQVLSALHTAATANGLPLAHRQRVVLLPHARTEPTDIRPIIAAQEGAKV